MDKAAMVKGASEEVGVSIEEREMLPHSYINEAHLEGVLLGTLRISKRCNHVAVRL